MPDRSFNDVIEKIIPLVKKAIDDEIRAKYKTPEEQERGHKKLEDLFSLSNEIWDFPKQLVQFNSDKVTHNLYEAVPITDEKFEEFSRKFLEITSR